MHAATARLEGARSQPVALGELRVSPPQASVRRLRGAKQFLLQTIRGLLVELLVGLRKRSDRERELIGRVGHVVEELAARFGGRVGHAAGRSALGRSRATGRLDPGFSHLHRHPHLCYGAEVASIANLLRSDERAFFDLFERAGENIVRAAELLDEMLARYPETADLAREILACEHDGDRITHDVFQRLNQTFVTPIDREDIMHLASALDDIVDYTEEVADYLGLYKIEAPMAQAQRLAGVLRDGTRQIAAAIPLIRGFKDISAQMVEVHRL
ncbi:MAG: DUF47 family protein, partial [Solirubrobacterales bacterium]|nr:DUF47 family protein [Solirubrobacterales bacterium]